MEKNPNKVWDIAVILIVAAMFLTLVLAILLNRPKEKTPPQRDYQVDSLGNIISGKDTIHLPPMRQTKDY